MHLSRVKTAVHEQLHRLGVDVVPYSGRYFASKRRIDALRRLAVRSVIDVAANEGQWARQLRRDGWTGLIVSLEPPPEAYRILHERSLADGRWRAFTVGAAVARTSLSLNIAASSASSSFLDAGHHDAPDARYVGTAVANVVPLDDLVADAAAEAPFFIKVDTQGYELEVLRGAASTLSQSSVVELELSFLELYEGQPLADEVLRHMLDRHFFPVSAEPVLIQNGRLAQADYLFERLGPRDFEQES